MTPGRPSQRRLGPVLLIAAAVGASLGGAADLRAQTMETSDPETRVAPGDALLAQAGDRRRPGPQRQELDPTVIQDNPGSVPPPEAVDFPRDHLPIEDRWRLIETLGIVRERWWDPYSQNTLKGDRPVFGTQDWFVALGAISDTVIEPRSFPLPVGVQTTNNAGSLDAFGRNRSLVFSQSVIASLAIIKGSTAFKPPDIEIRVTPVFNFNRAVVQEKRILHVEASRGTDRNDQFTGLQEAFLDYHLRNVSDRYDFDSVRVGIQPFTTDFRGFLFIDNQFGLRLFGNRDNNRWQYNLAAFRRLEKDTNSGLNDIGQGARDDYVFVANLYRQDLPFPGLTSQVVVAHNMNREADENHVDKNGFPARPALFGTLRPREYDVTYLGYNADGHVGGFNLTGSLYGAYGSDRNNPFTDREARIRAFFAAVEPSIDFDWIRLRVSAAYASGDSDPYDDTQTGFDAIFENPQFAGADTSYWIRQSVPLIGGARAVGLSGRNGLLPSLRSSKEQGQSNFVNPGLRMLGVGADLDLTPEVRLSFNANRLAFDRTEVLQALRMQGGIDRSIGWDLSSSLIVRPNFTQNFVFRLSGAVLLPGDGFRQLYSTEGGKPLYSVLFNGVITY
jgi:hypothetical protein